MHHLPCEPCKKGVTPVSNDEIAIMLAKLTGWRVLEIDGIKRLRCEFKFSNFTKAMAFTNAVADIAEAEQHHPEILTEWGRVTVTWWTHSIRGLHKNDFIMAARTSHLLEPSLDS